MLLIADYIRNLKKMRMQSILRWFKLKFLQLQREKNGASIVARGFAIGLAIEMFTLPTFGLAFLLIFPLVYIMRASLVGALIGFVLGKVIYMPMLFINKAVGRWALSSDVRHYILSHLPSYLATPLRFSLELIIGGMIVGAVLGIISYFLVLVMLKFAANKRKEKRRLRKEQDNALPDYNEHLGRL